MVVYMPRSRRVRAACHGGAAIVLRAADVLCPCCDHAATVPRALRRYVRSQEGLDVLVEDAVRLLLRLLLRSRGTALAAAAAAALAAVLLIGNGVSLVLRLTAAAAAALAAL
eukprot:24552-Chlamydomonas_euryale.AAC.1